MGVVLSDGAELYLAADAELALNNVNQLDAAQNATKVSLTYGRLLIHYKNADPPWTLSWPSLLPLRWFYLQPTMW